MPREFLKDYKGVLVTDGYQVYHKLAGERPDELRVAGCWAHCKRKFDDVLKALKTSNPKGAISAEAHKRIAAIYHVDNMCKTSTPEERLDNRQKSVKPLVDAFFSWLKSIDFTLLDKSGALYGAIRYALNQEPYLRAFLDDPIIPLDNNDAERSIRKFCVGKHSWHIIGSRRGARASAILYSIAETSKANGLKPYEYFKYLLEQMLTHLDDKPADYIDDLLPWSEKIPEYCRLKTFEWLAIAACKGGTFFRPRMWFTIYYLSGVNPNTDKRFVKNGKSIVDALLTFHDEKTGGFRHVNKASGGFQPVVDQMATEQAYYALAFFYQDVPAKTTLSKTAKSGSGKLKVTWKKAAINTDYVTKKSGKTATASGYQIVCANNKKYSKNVKRVTVSGSKTLTKTVTNLKKGKTYYVKVRAYKTVNGKKLYGAYSAVKRVQC